MVVEKTYNVHPCVTLACEVQGTGLECRKDFDQVREEAELYVMFMRSTK